MDESSGKTIQPSKLPFNNLFLNSGFVSGFNEWWMYLVTIFVTISCYAFAPLLTFIPVLLKGREHGIGAEELSKDPNKLFDAEFMGVDKNLVLIALLGIFVITAAGFLISIRNTHKKNLGSLMTGYEKFRFRRFWFAFAVWGGLISISIGVSYFLDPAGFTFHFEPLGFLISVILMVVFMPVQTGFEEVFFRGYLLQGIAQLFKNGLTALLITSFLFGLVHMKNPEVIQYGWAVMFAYYFFFALFMGALTLLDEGLELAFGIHFANNLVSSVLISVPGSVLRTYSVFETKSEDPLAEIVLWFCMALVTFGIFWIRYRWKNFKLILN